MLYIEWLGELIPEISEGVREVILENRGLKPYFDYEENKEIELAEADLYVRASLMPSFSEGSLSIKYDISSLKEKANSIYEKWGDEKYNSGIPVIKRVKL
tara:strand:+ start:231 stop:530 length:300 start_codon:yes stop_codon:yes gene_type:complete